MLAFLINLALEARSIRIGGRVIMSGSFYVSIGVLLAEFSQLAVPTRSFSLSDLDGRDLGSPGVSRQDRRRVSGHANPLGLVCSLLGDRDLRSEKIVEGDKPDHVAFRTIKDGHETRGRLNESELQFADGF